MPGPRDVFRIPGYVAFWSAYTVSGFGTYITTLALEVLVVESLHGTATDVGLLNAARWLPYLFFGLVAGALVDRRRRKPILVGTDLARGILLLAIPLLYALGWLNLVVLIVFVAFFGVFSLFGDAASQSFLPRIVAKQDLLAAHARVDQSDAVAQTSGPLVAGGLVTLLGAFPLVVPLQQHARNGVRCIRPAGTEVVRVRAGHHPGRGRRHRAARNHVLHQVGMRWGAGRAVIICNGLMSIAWAIIAVVPTGSGQKWFVILVLVAGQALYGLALGLSNANEMGYRQAVTPDHLQGRMNTTIRSANRAMIVVGAPAGGLLAVSIGYQPTLWIAIAGFVAAAVFLAASPFRSARHGEATD